MSIATIVLLALATGALFVVGVAIIGAESDRRRVIYASDLDDQRSAFARISAWTERRLLTTSWGRRLRDLLDRADVSQTVGVVGVGLVAALVLVWLAAWQLAGPVLSVIALVVVLFVLRGYLRSRIEKRRQRFIDQLPELARLLANATQAGLALRASLGVAAQESNEPMKSELDRLNRELAVGSSLDEALERLGRRMPSREVSVLLNVLVIQLRAGGRIVTALRGITEALETRRDLRREVATLLAGTKATVMSVAGLGAVMLLLINTISEGGLRAVLENPLGLVLFLVCGGIFLFGLWLVRRIAAVEV
ncbi:type II secretion system F family protein [Nocardioides sp.]|uniref:type II secretion system F family protein n=1 Tax=Nocardioides sp. TaxID=35761 RepID=UPI0039E5B0A9